MARQRGQAIVEWLGVMAIVVVLVGATATVAPSVAAAVGDTLVCIIDGDACFTAGPNEPAGDDLQARIDNLAPWVDAKGGRYRELLDVARAASERGDDAQARRLLDQIDFYRATIGRGRGALLDDTVRPTDAAFDDLVGQGTIELGDTNRRYFRVPPSPGDGVVVFDYFIKEDNSAFVRGDGRGLQDPLLGDLAPTDSRIVVVIDRESGRAMITQSQTCTVSVFGNRFCQAPRPIELRSPQISPQLLPGDPNEFDVRTNGSTIDLDYDALNSITPGAVSVDGGVTLERGSDGRLHKTRDTRDDYPARAIYQYRPGEDPYQVDWDPGGSFIDAVPKPQCDLPGWIGFVSPTVGIVRELTC